MWTLELGLGRQGGSCSPSRTPEGRWTVKNPQKGYNYYYIIYIYIFRLPLHPEIIANIIKLNARLKKIRM
jgi:hypothetical protein